jgi:K(+)-stimulated pyrophosphate-energized sodium pump
MLEFWSLAGPIVAVASLVLAFVLLLRVKALPAGNARMVEISGYIREGSMAFLNREFRILGIFTLVAFVILFWGLGSYTAWSFLLGAVLSLVAGYIGMNAATSANTRTAEAARSSGKGNALLTAFDGGAVMGLCVAGLGLLGMSLLYKFLMLLITSLILFMALEQALRRLLFLLVLVVVFIPRLPT